MKRIFPIIQGTNCSFFHLHFVFKSSVNYDHFVLLHFLWCCFSHTSPKGVVKFIVDVWIRTNFIWGFIGGFFIQSVLIMIGCDHFIDFTVLFQSSFGIEANRLMSCSQVMSS